MEPSYPDRLTAPPDFAGIEWLRQAMDEIENRPMTPEEGFQFICVIARNAQVIQEKLEILQDALSDYKTQILRKAIRMNLSIEQIAQVVRGDDELVVHPKRVIENN